MISSQDITDAASDPPCGSCNHSKACKHECQHFKLFVETESRTKRKQQLITFKLEQAEWKETA